MQLLPSVQSKNINYFTTSCAESFLLLFSSQYLSMQKYLWKPWQYHQLINKKQKTNPPPKKARTTPRKKLWPFGTEKSKIIILLGNFFKFTCIVYQWQSSSINERKQPFLLYSPRSLTLNNVYTPGVSQIKTTSCTKTH